MKFSWPWSKKRVAPRVVTLRSYAAAKNSRLTADFLASSFSFDGALNGNLPAIRNRTRALARDNDYVKGALRTISTNVIGEGIGFQAQVKKQRATKKGSNLDEATNTAIEAELAEWSKAKHCHVAGKYSFEDMQAVIIRGVAKNGESLIRIHRGNGFGTKNIPIGLELLSSDMLDDTYNVGRLAGGGSIKMGVELDRWKRPVAYWFHSQHPNDFTALASYSTGQRVRVSAGDIIHLFVPEDEEQTRGVPWFASAILRLHNMQGYEEAEIIAARASACRMGFIKTPEAELQGDDVVDDQRVVDYEAGATHRLGPGEEWIDAMPSRPGGQFDPFMKVMLRGVAAGIGQSYETLSKDYAGATYSSARQALLEDRDTYRVLQRWMIRNFHQRVLDENVGMLWLTETVSMPLFLTKPELYTGVKWMPRGWSWIDPAKEGEAYKNAVRSGFMTHAEVLAMNGGDFDEWAAQRKREQETYDALGLVLDTDPRVEAKAAEAQAKKPAEVNPSEEKPPAEDE
jgi:lambda family phage portal protein